MGWIGMNDKAVEQAGREIEQAADKLKGVISKVDGSIAKLKNAWHGEDSKRFISEWEGTHKHELQAAEKMLRDLKTKIDANVKEQRATSQAL